MLRTISLSQETFRYLCFKPEIVSQAHKIHTLGTQKISNILKTFEKFCPIITKIGVIKKVDHHPRNYAAAY